MASLRKTPWRNSSNRRFIVFHVTHLDRGCVGTQQNIWVSLYKKYPACHEPDGILAGLCSEIMPIVFDFWPFGHVETDC
jgi:hypothetical protein